MDHNPAHNPKMDRTASLLLAFAAIFMLLDFLQIAYRFSLPTEGWEVYTTDLVEQDWIFDANLIGKPSGLQPGDTLVAVDGLSTAGTASLDFIPPPTNWEAGQTVQMTVRRNGQTMSVNVPVVHWTLSAVLRHNLGELSQLAYILGALIFLGIGWFTFLRRPSLPSARALLMLSTAIGANAISGLLPDGLSVQFDRFAFAATGFYSYLIFGTFLAPSLLAFSLLFPRPKQAILRRPALALLPYALGLGLLVYIAGGSTAWQAGWYSTLGMFIASLSSLVHAGFTQRDAASAAQLRWAVSGFVIGLGLFMLNFPIAFGWVSNPVLINVLVFAASLGFPVIGIGFAVSVLRYRLYDIDIIIRKTLIYGILTGALILVYFASVVLLQVVIPPQSQLGTVFSTLAIAALFSPLRRGIQSYIDRIFYRQKYNAAQTLAEFSASARDEVDLETLSFSLLAVIENTMQPGSVILWLKEAKRADIRKARHERG